MSQGWWVFWAIVVGFVAVAWYVIHSRIFPYANCYRCKGNGRFRSASGRSWRHCGRCKGSGSRVRLGRRIWSKLAAAKKAAVD